MSFLTTSWFSKFKVHRILVSRGSLPSVRKSGTLGNFEKKQPPLCAMSECLEEDQRDPKTRNGCCAQGPLVFDDAFAYNVLSRLRALEHRIGALELDRDETIKDNDKVPSLVFLGNLYLWMRDTVLNKAITDTKMSGELVMVDRYAEGAIHRYLPSAVTYVVLGKDKVQHEYSDDLESNFIKFEAHVQDALKVDLRTVFQGIHTRNKALHSAYTPPLRRINTRTGLAELSLFLKTAQSEQWPDRVSDADKAQVAVMMQLLRKYLIQEEEEATLRNEFLARSRKSGSHPEREASWWD